MHLLILGASGWIGEEAARAALKDREIHVLGGKHLTSVMPVIQQVHMDTRDPVAFANVLEDQGVDVVVNALGWKAPKSFLASCLCWARARRALFVHISSASVFDGDGTREHGEDDPPCPGSECGKVKAIHERLVEKSQCDFAILRLSAPHGSSPIRETRTKQFLRRLSNGESVSVDTGVIQNRLASQVVGEQIVGIAKARATGIFHLGTEDSSEEVDFLRRLAREFGYAPDRIVPQSGKRPRNVVVRPERVYAVLGESARMTEDRTIALMSAMPQFTAFRLM